MAVTLEGLHFYKLLVLEEVAKKAFEGQLNHNTPNELALRISKELNKKVRCCVYKDREIIRERANMAMGNKPDGTPFTKEDKCLIKVLEAACDGCTVHRVRITDSCRKCLAQSCLNTCKFEAIYIGNSKAHIDYEKCKACGMCVKACSYSAIVMSERPCKKACPTGAMKHINGEIAQIDEAKCINCGQCARACPFNAISEYSMVGDVIHSLLNKEEIYAVPAPAVQSQFNNATLPQIFNAIKMLGFTGVEEVAIGADFVTISEGEEVKEKIINEGKKMTTSCCPAFYDLLKLNYPNIYKEWTSTTVSPMVAIGRYLKAIHPNCKVCFIGPCVAKKSEMRRKEVEGAIDYVLTFEELLAMFKAQEINPALLENTPFETSASIYGRRYSQQGGVSGAVRRYLDEEGVSESYKAVAASNIELLDQLKLIKLNRFDGDLLEGMMCLGGCNGGVSSLEANTNLLKIKSEKENTPIKDSNVNDTKRLYDMSKIDMHYKKEEI